ncbi:c-type cytochrome [Endozoicomonadaceae bacterium StTr2]
MKTTQAVNAASLFVKSILVGGLLAGSLQTFAAVELDDASRAEIVERIQPMGHVCKIGEDCANGAAVASASSGPREPEAIFNQYCGACHNSGLLGAPKVNDDASWNARLQAAGDFTGLLNNAINGIKAMPPKGTCMDCTDDEISATITYMSKLKP